MTLPPLPFVRWSVVGVVRYVPRFVGWLPLLAVLVALPPTVLRIALRAARPYLALLCRTVVYAPLILPTTSNFQRKPCCLTLPPYPHLPRLQPALPILLALPHLPNLAY